ncbi:MAG: hypothetical protein M1608_00780, partial [Candidatus Omnitrophica bacterium]|nr:hypothetical protein [Candidatus Omnitrophota bacterium]
QARGHWYYFENAFSVQGLSRFADVMTELHFPAAQKYRYEAEAFRADVRRAVERDVDLAPVRLARDGTYRSYIPWMAYSRGLMNTELGAPQYGGGKSTDLMLGALPLASPSSVLEPDDPRVVDTLDVLEESGTSTNSVRELEDARKKKGLPTDDAWFWMVYIDLPKWSFNPSIYLLQDDVPCFLRFWMNESVSMVGNDGKLWEHWHLNSYGPCEYPDNGTAGWFIANFRNMLAIEDGASLWVARGTPRAWLEQGKKIAVKNAPTYFGTLAYEIASDVDHGQITATLELPSRNPPKNVFLRFRHPRALPIKSATLNGRDWVDFDADKELIILSDVQGRATVVANY